MPEETDVVLGVDGTEETKTDATVGDGAEETGMPEADAEEEGTPKEKAPVDGEVDETEPAAL